jgi:proline racemase
VSEPSASEPSVSEPSVSEPSVSERGPGAPLWDVRTVDYHTAGEPFRIVLSGARAPDGATVVARREQAARGPADELRRLLCHEPRGHADMYGGLLVPPDDDGAHLGVLFWHKDGWSTACGHGTIALGAWAVESGLVPAGPDGTTDVVIDVPSGRVTARVEVAGGRVGAVSFANVPSWVVERGVRVTTPSFGALEVDLSWGGALYASAAATAAGTAVEPRRTEELIRLGREVKAALAGHPATRHPEDTRLSGVYGTVIWQDEPAAAGGEAARGADVVQRNVTVFADGQVDRSPCGSGTSARLALLDDEGALAEGAELEHLSLVGTRFHGLVTGRRRTARGVEVLTEVRGSAHRTGEHRFLLARGDELGTGFVLR